MFVDKCPFVTAVNDTWTFGDEAGKEIILEKAGRYSILASIEKASVEQKFLIK